MRIASTIGMVAAAVTAVAAMLLAVIGATPAERVVPGVAVPASSADAGSPTRITIPAIDVDARLVPTGLRSDGAMQIPDFGLAGWYSEGPQPGQPGPAVVVAHVDSSADGPDVFYRLRELDDGDRVTVHYPRRSVTFVVTGSEQVAKIALPAERIWSQTDEPVLRLITCGGAFDRSAGSYLDNIVVYADRIAVSDAARQVE